MRIKVKPARPGLIVRDPTNGFAPIPDGGAEVERTSAIIRRINDGDLVIVERTAAPKKDKE
jgi:hypothetical protein